jgi:hypothetical protein
LFYPSESQGFIPGTAPEWIKGMGVAVELNNAVFLATKTIKIRVQGKGDVNPLHFFLNLPHYFLALFLVPK